MKIDVKVIETYNICYLHAKIGVRYWEDGIVNGLKDDYGELIPFRNGDYWHITINVDTGQIKDWPKGTIADIHYKVCDDCFYELLDANYNELFEFQGYFPTVLSPGGLGFGDYVIMKIDETGYIEGWDPDFIYDLIE